MIYQPEQDSYLLAEQIKIFVKGLDKSKNTSMLDMGSGSGIQAITAIQAGVNKKCILCADINKETVVQLKKKNLIAIASDLFNKINRKYKFNLIVFNPPYLPEDKYDKQPDTTAGKRGNEMIIKFLKQAKAYLAEDGVILLLFSSLSHPEEILKEAKKLRYDAERMAEKSAGMMERLYVYKLVLS